VVCQRDLDSFGEFPAIVCTQAAAEAILSVEHLDQPGIVPVLDIVVGAVMNLDFDRISMIVNQEDDDRQL
jgi:hypothetical protein